MIFRTTTYALIAISLIFLATPIIPSWVLIQPRDLSVDKTGTVQWTRTVTVPTTAQFTTEIFQGRAIRSDCNASGETYFEARGYDPVEWRPPCDLSNGDHSITICVEALGPLGVRLAPSCLSADFRVGPDLEMQQQILEQKVIELQETLRGVTEK